MSIILPVNNKMPLWGDDCYIAPNATLIGDVVMGNDCSVWFNAVVRGDVNFIKIGDRVNIQDGVVIHGTYQKNGTVIGDDVSIGHNAIVHGCTLENHVLIGMGAIVMDRAIVEPFCIIAAGAIVLEGTVCESGFIYAGNPIRKIKPVSEDQRALLQRLPINYMLYASWLS